VQAGINLEDLRLLPIPSPGRSVQQYIGDKVRHAERLLQAHGELGRELKIQMHQCFRGHARPAQKTHSRLSHWAINPLRLEAEYYQPIALWAEDEIKGSKWSYEPLSELATRIKDGPGGWGVSTNDYVASGVPVVRGVNLENGECDLTGCVFLTAEKHEELRSHCTYRGNVLLSVRGTIGRSAVFDVPEYDEASLNAAVVTIECKDRILPHFLAEFFNSEIGCIQSARIANGAVQQNMNLTETGNNLIVVPPKDFQEAIVAQRVKWLGYRRFSKSLVVAAKLLVEGLVEGKISESELNDAQRGLASSDHSCDRLIISRLRHDGVDGGGRPVIADIDALYAAIDEVERDKPINGDAP
jgi:type I restriction enzyme S subunit